MKRKENVRDLLGLTQHELAALLNVSRSNFSLYELGKRSLPPEATLLLADMLAHVQAPERTARTLPLAELQQNKMRTYLQRLLAENDYQRVMIEKEIAAATTKHDAQLRLLQLAEFLKNLPQRKASQENMMRKAIERKAAQAFETEGLAALVALELKKELLEVENMLIQSKLLRFTWYPKNTEVL